MLVRKVERRASRSALGVGWKVGRGPGLRESVSFEAVRAFAEGREAYHASGALYWL